MTDAVLVGEELAAAFVLELREVEQRRLAIRCLDPELAGHHTEQLASHLTRMGLGVRKSTDRHRVELQWPPERTLSAVLIPVGLALEAAVMNKPPSFTGASGPTSEEP